MREEGEEQRLRKIYQTDFRYFLCLGGDACILLALRNRGNFGQSKAWQSCNFQAEASGQGRENLHAV